MLTVETRGKQARRWVLAAALVAVAMVASQLPFAHFAADDFFHRAVLEGTLEYPFAKWDLYRFFPGNPADVRPFMDAGLVPWFTDPEIKIAFLRPLSSLMAVLDHRLFGDWPTGYLLHGGAWYVLACALVAHLYQRLMPGPEGGVAGLLFAVLATHQQPVGLFSARNALVAGTFGLLALTAHLNWRERGTPSGLPASLAFVALALATGEAGLGGVALIVAYELARRGPLAERLRAASPTLGICAFYFAAYIALDYGTHASAAYVNPMQEPLAYLRQLPLRLSASFGVLLAAVPADLWFVAVGLRRAMAVAGVVAALALGLWLRAALARAGDRRERVGRWWLLAVPLSLLPQMAGMLGPRSYFVASVASVGILATLIAHGARGGGSLLRRLVGKSGALALLLLHGAGGVASWIGFGAFLADVGEATDEREKALDLDRPEVEDETLVLISVPDVFVGVYLPMARHSRRQKVPRQWRVLSLAECDHVVTRTGDATIELELDGGMFETPFEEVYRRSSRPLAVGSEVSLDGFSARVLGTNSRGHPNHFEMRFERSIDDERVRLVGWDAGELRAFPLARGESRRLEWRRPF